MNLPLSAVHFKVLGLCAFIAFLSFKPSEPYLSQYLICNLKTAKEACSAYNSNEAGCISASLSFDTREDGYGDGSCSWSISGGNASSTSSSCSPMPCSLYPLQATTAGSIRCADVNYCSVNKKTNTCLPATCYKTFSENEVNNYIYPWSTYAYLPALLFLCPLAELVSYRLAILVGIAGRVITRFLLLYGESLAAMQLMQVSYSIGTAAEDIFYAYVFYAVPTDMFQTAMSTCRTSALISCLIASILGDLLVTQADTPLTVLQIISCVFVCFGAALGFVVIQPSSKTRQFIEIGGIPITAAGGLGVDIKPTLDAAAGNADLGAAASPEPHLTRSQIWMLKWKIFVAQCDFFKQTLVQDPNLCNQVLYWVVANATFTEMFGYEVAIFQQLNGGSNQWNGSVLSVMLLLGAVGAMLPVYLKVDSPEVFNSHSINKFIVAAGAAGTVFLFVFVYVWKAITSLAMLSLFVACWQFISCIILVQVATQLKLHHDRVWATNSALRDIDVSTAYIMTSKSDDAMVGTEDMVQHRLAQGASSSGPATAASEPPSYAIAIVSLVAVSVVLQSLTVTIVFSGLQLGLQDALMVPVYLFAISSFIFMCACMYRKSMDGN